MKGKFIIIFLTTLAVTLAQQPNWVTTIMAKCDGKKSFCLGAIIADDRLITAASCFSHCSADDSVIVKFEAQSNSFKVEGDVFTTHPDYATSQAADLAVVKFNPENKLATATIINKCKAISNAVSLSIINLVNEKKVTQSPVQKDDNKECKKLYPDWQPKTQNCFNATDCVEKPGSFIADNTKLYAMTTFDSGCSGGSNKKAALVICEYHEWIQDQLAGCPSPTEIQNGEVDYDSTTDGSEALYKCDNGYKMKGRKKLTCMGTRWNRNPPSCVQTTTKPPPTTQPPTTRSTSPPTRAPTTTTCSHPPSVFKALINLPDSHGEGAVVKYSCAIRYRLVGDKKLTCRGGRWTGVVPRCQDCPLFRLPNGNFHILNTSTFLYATSIECNPGYRLNGTGFNHCENGKWKHTQSCDIKQCPIPEDIPIGSVQYRNPPEHGSLAVYSCPHPYVVSGFQKRLCNNGKWEGYPPKCKKNTLCPPYKTLPCGTTSNNGGRRDSATVTYTPASNAMLIGPSVITCQSNGEWSSPMPTCRIMCPVNFKLENGDYKLIMDDTKVEYHLEIICKEGYIIRGISRFTCKDGAWDRIPIPPICVKECPCLDVRNGNVICNNYGDFTFATISCKRGYRLDGRSPAICQYGVYFSTPKCIRK